MKKRIFIAIHYLEIGGAETSRIGLLQSIDYSRYEVDLFLYSHRGELMEFVPSQVNLLPEDGTYAHYEEPLVKTMVHGYFSLAARRLWAKVKFRSYVRSHPGCGSYPLHHILAECVLPAMPSLKKYGKYDLAISFLQPHNFVLEKVDAAKKICWIHTDYSSISAVHQDEGRIWGGYDHIVSISDAVSESFVKVFPALKKKLILVHNMLSAEFVKSRSEALSQEEVEKEMPKEEGVVNLLSVGRFCEAKNYDNVPDICRRIVEGGTRVRWYLIGYGSDESLIRQKIRESGIEENVIILGKKSNPYPYMKACDVYVQPSRYEGNSVTVREAQILGRSVVITDYSTARSQVEDGVDGIIVPLENKACAEGLRAFLSDGEKIKQTERNLSRRDYTNCREAGFLDNILK